jgi:hypothetical protein
VNYLIGYFSRRQVFHIVAYRENIEEVKAYLKTHNANRLIVYAAQPALALDAPQAAIESDKSEAAHQ